MPPTRRLNNQTDLSPSSASSSSIAYKPYPQKHNQQQNAFRPSSPLPTNSSSSASSPPSSSSAPSSPSSPTPPATRLIIPPHNPTLPNSHPATSPSSATSSTLTFVKFAWFWVSAAFWLWWLLSNNNLREGSDDGMIGMGGPE